MIYLGYEIGEDIDGQFVVDVAPGTVLVFASLAEAKSFIDGICAYNA